MEENKQGYDPSEFEDDDYMTSQPVPEKSIRGYRIVIIILAVILAAITVLYYNIHRQQITLFIPKTISCQPFFTHCKKFLILLYCFPNFRTHTIAVLYFPYYRPDFPSILNIASQIFERIVDLGFV